MTALLMVLVVSLIVYPILIFAYSSAQVKDVKTISQNALDGYTIKTGKKVIQSVKCGHDYTKVIDDKAYMNDFSDELNTAIRFKAFNSQGKRIFTINDIDMKFITDKTLKTTVTYTLNYQFYFLSQPAFSKDIHVKLGSRYNLKY